MSDPTQPMGPGPQGQPPRGPQQPATSQPQPDQPATGQPAQAGPSQVPPAGPAYGSPPQPPPGGSPEPRPALWRQATSTTGGRIATVVALALTGLLLMGVVAAGVFAIARTVGPDHVERAAVERDNGRGLGNQKDKGNRGRGGDERLVPPGQDGQGERGGPPEQFRGNPFPGLKGALGGLGEIQHGEFTTTSSGATVVMTLQRGEVTSASATSVAVKSTDGFAATYVVNANTATTGPAAAELKPGDAVVVLARKDNKTAVLISPDRSK